MDVTIMAALVGGGAAILGAVIALGGVFLQVLLSHKFTKHASLVEARRALYSKLLSSSLEEEMYPEFRVEHLIDRKAQVEDYNNKLKGWRANRKYIKSLAAEALLIADSPELRNKLRDYIDTSDPEVRLVDIEQLMRKEIGLVQF